MNPFDIYQDDRVAVFIDGPSTYGAARFCGFSLDFKKIHDIVNRERLLRAYYFTPMAETEEFNSIKPLVDWLGYNGFKTVTKDAKEHFDSEGRKRIKNTDLNVDITIAALNIADRTDHAIFFTGDGSLTPLIEALQEKGVRTTVVSTREGSLVSEELRKQADTFIDISTIKQHIQRVM